MRSIKLLRIFFIILLVCSFVALCVGCNKPAMTESPAPTLTQPSANVTNTSLASMTSFASSTPIAIDSSLLAVSVAAQFDNALAASPTPAPTPVLTPTPVPTPTPKPTPVPEVTKVDKRPATVTEENIIFRKEPSLRADKLGILKTGAILTVTGKVLDFYQVTYQGEKGFVAKKFVKLSKFSEKELTLAARLITAEGRGQSVKGYETMAQVVYNRVVSYKFPNTIEGVAYQKGQFQVTFNREWFNKVVATPRAINAVYAVFVGGKRLIPMDVCFFKSAKLPKEWGPRVYYSTLDGTMYYK